MFCTNPSIKTLFFFKKKKKTVLASTEYFDRKHNNLLSWFMFYFVNITRMWRAQRQGRVYVQTVNQIASFAVLEHGVLS